jgi:hypothetical protein
MMEQAVVDTSSPSERIVYRPYPSSSYVPEKVTCQEAEKAGTAKSYEPLFPEFSHLQEVLERQIGEMGSIGMGNATAWFSPPQELYKEFRTLFAAGREEFFEDGMESNFSRRLIALVDEYGNDAVDVLKDLIIGEQVNPEVASEALRWVGQIENPTSRLQRRRLLEQSLYHSSPNVRDGALLGLASMDDSKAISSLRRAIEQETVEELRQDMEQVIEQLRVTLGWPRGYFDKTAGSLADDPIERGSQEEYEEREELL